MYTIDHGVKCQGSAETHFSRNQSIAYFICDSKIHENFQTLLGVLPNIVLFNIVLILCNIISIIIFNCSPHIPVLYRHGYLYCKFYNYT
jgi:hypothetical protein